MSGTSLVTGLPPQMALVSDLESESGLESVTGLESESGLEFVPVSWSELVWALVSV